jgi:predicted amidohydrolase
LAVSPPSFGADEIGGCTLKIGFLQLRPRFGQVRENVRAAHSLLKNVSDATIVLPELFNTGYLFRSRDELDTLAESAATGYTVTEMKKIARQKNLTLVFGIAEKKGARYYNTAVLVTAKGKVSTYQKTHLFDREKLFFAPGENRYVVHKIDGARIGMMVCFDWCFPEVTRILALQGAQIVCHPANLVMPYCQDAMRTRSVENRVFTITANRIGAEKRGTLSVSFTGHSQIVDPSGNVLASAGDRSESLKIVDVLAEEADNKAITSNNDLFKDRKVSLYGPLIRKSAR